MLWNFRDAGVKDIDWLLIWAKDKELEILKEHGGIGKVKKSEDMGEVTVVEIDDARQGCKDIDDIEKMI